MDDESKKRHISVNLHQREHDRIDALVIVFGGMGNDTKRATVAASALTAGLAVLEAKVTKKAKRARGVRA